MNSSFFKPSEMLIHNCVTKDLLFIIKYLRLWKKAKKRSFYKLYSKMHNKSFLNQLKDYIQLQLIKFCMGTTQTWQFCRCRRFWCRRRRQRAASLSLSPRSTSSNRTRSRCCRSGWTWSSKTERFPSRGPANMFDCCSRNLVCFEANMRSLKTSY